MTYIPDDKIPFDAAFIDELLQESRERIKRKSAPYPDCWRYTRDKRPDLWDTLERYKKEFQRSYAAQDAPATHKWMFAQEHAVKKIITEYSKVGIAR